MSDPAGIARAALEQAGLEFTEHKPGVFEPDLPDTRNPDENYQVVYRWLLERNVRMYGVSFAVDHEGNILEFVFVSYMKKEWQWHELTRSSSHAAECEATARCARSVSCLAPILIT